MERLFIWISVHQWAGPTIALVAACATLLGAALKREAALYQEEEEMAQGDF
ncbi:MAG: hypothetical protein ACM3TU_02735 [Bacillota bacterium]